MSSTHQQSSQAFRPTPIEYCESSALRGERHRRCRRALVLLAPALSLVAACSGSAAAPEVMQAATLPEPTTPSGAVGAVGTGTGTTEPTPSNTTTAQANRPGDSALAGSDATAPPVGGSGTAGETAASADAAAVSGPVAGAAGAPAATSGRADGLATAGSVGGDPATSAATGVLPPVVDPGEPGSFTPVWEEGAGPGGNYTTIVPMELAQSEIKHPILIWGPGAGAYPEIYKSLLDHIASHGFVIVSYNTTPQGPELNEGIDWIEAESQREDSPFFNKVDTTKIAMGGQSAGSLATFQAGGDERLTTTLHINGGTFDGNVSRLIKPALFICGDDPAVSGGDGTWESDLARPNCDRDFENIDIPVWYGVVVGSSHTTVIDNPQSGMPTGSPEIKKAYLSADAAWLRWQLAGDETMKELFVGASCGYCTQTSTWLVQQKGLE